MNKFVYLGLKAKMFQLLIEQEQVTTVFPWGLDYRHWTLNLQVWPQNHDTCINYTVVLSVSCTSEHCSVVEINPGPILSNLCRYVTCFI